MTVRLGDFPIPIVRCELPTATAVVINDRDAGLFALVDDRVGTDDLARLADHLDLGLGLDPQWLPAARPSTAAARSAAQLRETIARQVTMQTRAQAATSNGRHLVVVGAHEMRSDQHVTTADSTTPPPAQAEQNREPDPLDLMGDRPHSARAYDYALGGKTNYQADRDLFEAVVQGYPTIRFTALSNRAFMHRAVQYLASLGIDQFLDIGTGIPTEPNLHQVAQSVIPSARVVYVDNDPIVLAHARALMVGTPEGATAYIEADARDPQVILGAADLRSTLDLSRPVAISACAMLHFLDDEAAERLIRTLLDSVPAGSALILSHATFDLDGNDVLAKAVASYAAAGITVWPRDRAQITGAFLEGLDVAEPGMVSTHRWRPDDEAFSRLTDADLTTVAVVARKP